MTERVSNARVRKDIEECESSVGLKNSSYHRALLDLLDARSRVKELEKWYDTVLSIVDSLDDPYRGVNWYGVTQELCARELEHLRSVLVPLVRGEQGGGDELFGV